MSEQLGSEWPFVGRGGQPAAVSGALRSKAGVMIAGDAGVGKSRLAARVLSGLKGYAVVRTLATETAAKIPFGAFAHVLTGPPTPGENLLRWAARHVRASAGDGELLVSVDGAHRLDPASAALVHHLAASGTARLLLTVLGGEPQPGPVAALWRDELVERIELPPLTTSEIGELLAEALGGEVAAGTVRRLAGVSQGNLRYLREIVHAGRTTGCLAERDGRWWWRGELSMTTRLRELVRARIGQLDQVEREVLELVAFGEPLGAELLVSLTSPHEVERLEDRGLIAAFSDGRRQYVRMGQPLHGEVVRGDCGTLRARRRLRTLAEALEATGLRRRGDVLRAAVWRLDSGAHADPSTLLSAANLAWAGQDPRLAARLAKAAAEAGAGVAASALLGRVLMVLGEADTALAALRRAARSAVTESERAEHSLSLGINLAWAGADAEACQVLDAAADGLTSPVLRQEMRVHRGVADFLAGRLTAAAGSLAAGRVRAGEPVVVGSGEPVVVQAGETVVVRAGEPVVVPVPVMGRAAQAAGLEAWIEAYSGRAGRALDVVERALAGVEGWRDEAPLALPTLLDARCAAQVFTGRLDAAARTAEEGMALGLPELSVSGFGAFRALVSRLRGEAEDAVKWAREDAARTPDRTPYQGRCLAELAHAYALLGRVAEARAALGEAWPAARWAFTRQPLLQAEVWTAAAGGDLDEAVRACLSAVDLAEKQEQLGHLVFALHDLVRLGAPALAADRLAALAGDVDGPLAEVCARHAAATRDAEGLRAVATEFERLGLILYAAEATAQEAAAYRGSGRAGLARGAQTRAWALARRCPGVSTPALVELATPDLTPRQREIVQLAAAGLTNRQIADRLTVSTRTAANHLQAVYEKLGVNDRTEVGRLLTSL